jgi:predicted CopG family antitoxin
MNFVPLIRCMARTTVSLRKATYDRLRKRGDASDSFDDVVNRLLEQTADNGVEPNA